MSDQHHDHALPEAGEPANPSRRKIFQAAAAVGLSTTLPASSEAALAKAHKARYLLASTSEVYGDPLEHPQKESYWGNVNPVGVRGVYSHFYYETFEIPRGCMPEVFQVVVRVLRLDTPIDVRWNGPSQIVIAAPAYRGNFVLSRDLRAFDTPQGHVNAWTRGPGSAVAVGNRCLILQGQ